jgi:hypothetical protein
MCHIRAMRFLLVALALLVMVAAASADAAKAPPESPKFWSVARCERVLPEQHPAIRQLICLGSGNASTCHWTSGHRARRYSVLTVFAWYRQANFSSLGMKGLEPGVVRSFVLSTRARPGFARIVHHYGDAYLGWPPDFYMGHVRLLGTHVGKDRFTDLVARSAAALARQGATVNCAGQ